MRALVVLKLHFSWCLFTTLRFLSGKYTINLNCEEIKISKSAAGFPVEELKTLTEEDLNSCFSLLGKEKLSVDQAEALWQLVLQRILAYQAHHYYCWAKIYDLHAILLLMITFSMKSRGPVEEIPEEDLRLLGWVTRGIPSGQFLNMSFTDIDTIAAFGRYYELSYDQLSALRDAVMEQWSNKDITDLSCFDLANLGHILCAFNASEIEKIHPDAYKDAASELSLLRNCSEDVLKSLAKLATNPDGFGDPGKWTALEISSIGCVLAGVPVISSIPTEAFKGISPGIVGCLPKSVFQAMSEAQLKLIPATSGMALGDIKLTRKQGAALEQAISGPATRNSAPSSNTELFTTAVIPILNTFYNTKLMAKSRVQASISLHNKNPY
ncbi:stereocilin-like [Homalodisca vitripennis]|uniref:stereocilin-like n=1 Tax=Homalodisca vitripennis TaxID=197043 RepID=UPI001EEBE12C|nr:stereocilin-like [Homalodisca vitripennis]